MELSKSEIHRYSRHLLLHQVGKAGQEKLKAAKVLCIGAGGLGCPAMMYLASAGVGHIGVMDSDVVDFSNLHRQILYNETHVGTKKVAVAKTAIEQLNPNVTVHAIDDSITHQNAISVISDYDIVLDCTDRFPARYAISDACVELKIPNISASLLQFEGQCSVFCAEDLPCYRCLYKAPPSSELIPNCSSAGVLGVLPGLLAIIQATEAIKLICKIGQPLINRMLVYDALSMQFNELHIEKDPNCPACGKSTAKRVLPTFSDVNAPTIPKDRFITASALNRLINSDGCFLLDVREPNEYEICNIDAYLIPLSELSTRLSEVPKNKRIVVHCKTGPRSIKAANLLIDMGYSDVFVLKGGITAWANDIDSSLAQY